VSNFSNVVICDFEYEVADGDLPNVLCMVAQVLDENLRHLRTIKLWRGEFGPAPPFDIGPDSLFVAYSAWAEMTCFKVLGWKFPVHIFDQHTAYLAASNILLPYNPDELRQRPRKRLEDACQAYDLHGWVGIDKEAISEAIGNGSWRGRYSPAEVMEYCAEDVRMGVALLREQLRRRGKLDRADVPRILHWSNYSAKCIALIQARGIPIDMPLWNLVQENKAAVIGEVLRRFDPSHGDDDPIYTPEGRWSERRFEQWLARAGIPSWPRLDSGKLDTDSDAFRMMYHLHRKSAHATRQHRLHCQGAIANRSRWSKSTFAIPIRDRNRTQRSPPKPVQRPCRRAGLHEISDPEYRRLSRLAHSGGRDRGCRIRRPAIGRGLSRRRHLSRPRAPLWDHDRAGPDQMETRKSVTARSHEAATARHQLRLDTGPDQPARRKPRIRKRFTKFPGTWEDVLSKAGVSNSTIWVAHVLLYETWRTGNSTVKLTGELLKRVHVGRAGKREALRKLVELHLVTTDLANGRNPVVTVHFAD
jgi:hypothetical protein